MSLALYPQLGAQAVDSLGARRLVVSTGLVTLANTRTASAGHLFAWRRSNATAATQLAITYVGARFTCTTAYGTAQRTGLDMLVTRNYTVPHTGGTSVDMGSTVVNTGELASAFPVSIMGTAAQVKVATTGDLTDGTHTLDDANPIGLIVGWTGAIGDQVPAATSGSPGDFGTLFGRQEKDGGNPKPLILSPDMGFILRNVILMGATGVGVWDICVEWEEGTQR